MGKRIDGETVSILAYAEDGNRIVATKEITIYKEDPQLQDNFQLDICAYGSWWEELFTTFDEVLDRLRELGFEPKEIAVIKDDKNWETY